MQPKDTVVRLCQQCTQCAAAHTSTAGLLGAFQPLVLSGSTAGSVQHHIISLGAVMKARLQV